MSDAKFVYVTYIRTTPEKLWEALTQPEFTRQYWVGCHQESSWQPGAPWKLMIPDGRVGDSGEVVAIDRPKRLVLKWRNEFVPEMRMDGYSQCTFTLEPEGDEVKLTIVHEADASGAKLIEGVSTGWPKILSSLKTLLETGESLASTRQWPKGM